MPGLDDSESGAAQQRLVSLREQQLSRRLGITLWSRLGDKPVFQKTAITTESVAPTDKTSRQTSDSDNLASSTLNPNKSKYLVDQSSDDLTHLKMDERVVDWESTPNQDIQNAQETSSDDRSANQEPKSEPESTQSVEDPEAGSSETYAESYDSAANLSNLEITPASEKTDSKSYVEPQQITGSGLPAKTAGGFIDPNDAFADAAFMDSEGFDDYPAASSNREAINELLGKLGGSIKSPDNKPGQSNSQDETALGSVLTYNQPNKTETSKRVEWLSFGYGSYLVVADAANISFDEQELLGSIARACRTNLLPISFPLNQEADLPVCFSDKQAFAAFIQGRLAQHRVKGLISLGPLLSAYEVSLEAREAVSLKACLDNPKLKADLWQQLNQA